MLLIKSTPGFSQDEEKDTAPIFTSDPIKLSFSPHGLLSTISLATSRISDSEKAMVISISAKRREKTPRFRPDSIILMTADDKMIFLYHPYKDSVYFLNDGGLAFTSFQRIDKREIEILKEEIITAIVLIIDNQDVLIKISNGSARKFKQVINLTL